MKEKLTLIICLFVLSGLAASAAIHAIRKGVDWFWKGHFFVHPSWREDYLMKYQNVYLPKGLALPQTAADGDGSMGIMEAHEKKKKMS